MRLVVLLAVLIRVLLVSTANYIPASDQRDYHVLAKNIYDGEGYIQIYDGESEQYQGITFRAYRSPGYPVFVSAVYSIFGPNPEIAIWINVLFETFSCALIFLLASQFSKRSAYIAALLFAITPLWTPLLMTESLFTMLFLILIYLSISKNKTLISGLILAFTVMVRPIGACLIPLFRNKNPILLLLPLILTLAFWNFRNYKVFNEPVFLTTNFGPHNAPDFGIDKVAEIKRLKDLGESKINSELTRMIINKIKEDPLLGVEVYFKRLFQLFSSKPPSELRSILWNGGIKYPEFQKNIISFMPFIYIIALISLPFALRNNFTLSFLLLKSSALFLLLHPLVSHGNLRFFAPLFPILCIFIGGAWKRKG